jgi:hypothetical protein
MDWLGRLFDITKLPSKFFAWVVALTAAYLFLPTKVLSALQLDKLPNEYKAYAGVAFTAAFVFLTINFSLWLFDRGKSWLSAHRYKARVLRAMPELDYSEKAIIREFFIQGRHVIELPMDHPTVAGLVQKGFLALAGKYGHMSLAGSVFPYSLTSVARESLTHEYIDLPEKPSEAEYSQLRNFRPNFLAEIERHDHGRAGW